MARITKRRYLYTRTYTSRLLYNFIPATLKSLFIDRELQTAQNAKGDRWRLLVCLTP
jgi:hypothetical protein